MSELPPETPGPDDLTRLEAMMHDQPDLAHIAVNSLASMHVAWYRAWIQAGAPERRAAQWAREIVRAAFRPHS